MARAESGITGREGELAVVTGTPAPQITWFKDGIPITHTNVDYKATEDANGVVLLEIDETKQQYGVGIKNVELFIVIFIVVARRIYRKIGHKILNKNNLENYKNDEKFLLSFAKI